MKIALVIPSLPRYSETFLTYKIQGLLREGFAVEALVVGVSEKKDIGIPVYYQPILAAKGPLRWLYSFVLIANSFLFCPLKSVKLLKVSKKLGYSFFGRFRMLVVLSNFLKINADWVHFAYGSMAVERAFIGEVINAKISVSFRGYDVSIFPLNRPGIYQNVWPFVSKIHSISNDLYSKALNLGLSKEIPVKVITPAIDLANYEDVKTKDWSGKPRFLTVARLHWKKGIELTLQALSELKVDFEYTLIGEGEAKERLIFAAHQLGIQDKVRFVGKQKPASVVQAMRDHEYYLQYSVQEGFCNAVLEAQASKMFCIVSDAEGLGENVLHEKTGLVIKKGDPAHLTLAIEQALHMDNANKTVWTNNAAKRVSETFSINQQQEAFSSFFKTL